MEFTGRVVLVTGGASGLGEATVRRFVDAGANVVIADLDMARGTALATELGDSVAFAQTEATDESSVATAIEFAHARWGGLHGLVHCAGIVAGERVLGKNGPHELASFARVVQVNLIGTFNVVRLAAAAIATSPADDDGQRGVIVTTSSIAAFDGQIGQAAYSASKGGIAAMTLPLARDLARHGIRVVSIAPGIFDTPMMACMSDEVRESLASQIPFPPRFGRPDEFAALVEHIFSNPMLNGEVIRLDGAVRMGPK
jgi:NAD(P)-dependent dehydrogenase (short-subunit alcohol dehydrogenase family)